MSPVRPRPSLPPDPAPADRTRPRFSIVTAVYNVEPYLRDFIDSIEGQTFDHSAIEVVAVDDGSTDGSLRILEEWARSTDLAVVVLSQPNAGQGAARNAGLEHATGEWVTFTDPDDMLAPDYFAVIDRFVEQNPRVQLLSGRTLLLDEATGAIRNSHPRRRQYVLGNRVANLDHEPNVFTASAAGAVVRLDRVRALGLRFDTRIRPNFEDGHFVASYLIALRTPTIGLLRDADYIYRKRAADDSTLNRSMRDPGRYTAVFEHGYLDVFAKARARYGRIPEWLQQLVIYELSWYFSEDEKLASRIRMSEETSRRFHELLPQVVRQLDPSAVYGHRVRKLKSIWADILAFGLRDRIWHSPVASRTRRDPYMDLQRVCYRYVGREPIEEFRLDGERVEPHFAKRMVHTYYGDVLMHERVAWLPAGGNLELHLDGMRVGIRNGWPPVGRRNSRPLLERGIAYARTAPEYLLTAVRRRTRGVVQRT
ncbi:MAG TPA: glycosyltransferase family A protein, partial [Candidatus Limnocylindrales bacterium]|nr:glycosyltransferase family A protein [Candidatus Limnocylindrales bacterium]